MILSPNRCVWKDYFPFLNFVPLLCVDRDSSLCIATRYDLGGPGIECRLGRVSPHPSGPVFGPTQPPVQWVLCHFSEGEARGIWLWPPHPPPIWRRGSRKSRAISLSPQSGLSRPVVRWTLTFLDAFEKLRKAAIDVVKSCPSGLLSAWKNSASTGRIFMKFDSWGFFEKLSSVFTFH